MTLINPYLTFNGNCSKVMAFYKECLGGELSLQMVEGSPMANQWPAEAQKNILHASLNKDGFVQILGSDMGGTGTGVSGNIISLSLSCSTGEELNTFFTNLSSGGQVRPIARFFCRENRRPNR